MKVFSQFPQILGTVLILLLLYCTFSSCSHSTTVASKGEDDSDAQVTLSGTPTTTATTSTGNGAGTGKTAPDQHVISIRGETSLDRKFECRGANMTNLTFIPCEQSIIECRKKLPCLVNGTMCTNKDPISSEKHCIFGESGENRTEKCLSLPLSLATAGIIKCTSFLSSSSSSPSSPTIQRSTTTIAYFYTATDSRALVHILNDDPLKPSLETLLNLKTGYSGEDAIENKLSRKNNIHLFYTNEEILIQCIAANFFVDLKSIKIEARTKNGTELQIDPSLYLEKDQSYAGSTQWIKTIQKFRVAKDIATLSCSGRRLDNSETIRRTLNVTVIDPPLEILAKSPNGSDFPVVSKIGCILSPQMSAEYQLMRRTLKQLLDLSRPSELRINSMIPFLRFQNITGGKYSCVGLPPNKTAIAHPFDYYFDSEVQTAKIEKSNGSSVVNLTGQSNRSLKCKYTGNPMPYVIWLRNGKTKVLEGQRDFEESVLHLPVHSKSCSELKSNEKYSCVVQNHLGADRLNFIIESEKGSPVPSKCKYGKRSNGLAWAVIVSYTLFILFISLAFYLILKWKNSQAERQRKEDAEFMKAKNENREKMEEEP